jgi:hypothetical protein
MSHLNGTAKDRIVNMLDEAREQSRHDLLDLLSQTVNRGRRDRNSIRRIVKEYDIPNDAGIIETIVERTADSVSESISSHQREYLS